ncbi:hypothetical protein ACFQU2_14665 [Siccirubricoccus deserti]
MALFSPRSSMRRTPGPLQAQATALGGGTVTHGRGQAAVPTARVNPP